MTTDPMEAYEDVVDAMLHTSAVKRSQMFGAPCLKIGGKAFACYYRGAMVFKLRGESETHGSALALEGAHLFDPSGRDHPMKEWVVVPVEHAARWLALCRLSLAGMPQA